MEDPFKSTYSVTEILDHQGATYYHDQVLDTFVKVASDQTSDKGFEGQVNVIVLGSNDYREISSLHPARVNAALQMFKYKLTQFVERMLKINNSTLILACTVLPKQFSNSQMKKIVGHVVR